MLSVAYLANTYPSNVETYVGREIAELRRRNVRVIAGSIRKAKPPNPAPPVDVVVLRSIRRLFSLRALLICIRHRKRIADLVRRAVWQGNETTLQRVKTLLHTWLGACYAADLQGRGVQHIHVHHGYFGAWVGMVAARLLRISYSLTLHGSDLLIKRAYIDTKLENCAFCLTISAYNRNYIVRHFPQIKPEKILVARLGVIVPEVLVSRPRSSPAPSEPRPFFRLLAVGRLHPVKDHAFLIRACARLCELGVRFECRIAGEGPERRSLQSLIHRTALESCATLLGHASPSQLDLLYESADLVALTSRSEGIPLVLMEAMARGKIVLAPRINGIPELVIAGRTGFLYEPGSMDDFLRQLLHIYALIHPQTPLTQPGPEICPSLSLAWMQHAGAVQVRHNFNQPKNLHFFADSFINLIQRGAIPHANSLLQ
ncbi:MAG TPA: glycosyltransferase family 4 protein [Candidatus Sulfotelmatobacter sp.]|nr:glycosyltransferase family 4 protein [Candidatus Sulfotelmatobacter sp.]